MDKSFFPDDKRIALVSGWDDGRVWDRRLAEELADFGWKGTFFLCPEQIGHSDYINVTEITEIDQLGHEIGSHSLNHPRLETLTAVERRRQAVESRNQLEAMVGKPVCSFAYPYGFGHREMDVATAVGEAGYRSARTTDSTVLRASTIEDWLRLPVTAHILSPLDSLREKWEQVEALGDGIFYLWGHSYEMGDDSEKWADLECTLSWFGGHSDVWYCTQGELCDWCLDRGRPCN